METIKADLKAKNLKHMYFFHGEETFLSEHYANMLKKEIADDEFNFTKLYAEDIMSFQDAVETPPVFADKKLVMVKARDFSEEIKSDGYNLLADILDDVPDYTHVLFICTSADKRSRIYKLLSSKCTECVFDFQKEAELVKWITNVVRKKGFDITGDAAAKMIEFTGCSMVLLMSEIDKAISCNLENNTVTADVIEKITCKTVETKVFEMMDAVMEGNAEAAFKMLADLKREKEEPVFINGAIVKCISDALEYKLLVKEGVHIKVISDRLRLWGARQKKLASYDKRFSERLLCGMISKCAEFDISLKTSGIDGYTGISVLMSYMLTAASRRQA